MSKKNPSKFQEPPLHDADGSQNGAARQPERRRVRLADLVPNAEQSKLYDDLSEGEFKMLVEDIRQRDFEHPIETYAPVNRFGRLVYEILDGHQRKRVAEILGMDEVDILVRFDLLDASQAEKQIAFISANLTRRHLDTVARVRAAIRQYQWQHANGRDLATADLTKVRDKIGKLIGLSGRMAGRYFRLAQTPLAVQRAVSAGLLRVVSGEQVLDLRPDLKAAIAQRIGAATSKKEVQAILADFGLAADRKHKEVDRAVASFVKALERGHHDLRDRLDKVSVTKLQIHLKSLTDAQKTIQALIDKVVKSPTTPSTADHQVLKDMMSKRSKM